ncbi:MAG: T9SS type A sorting domain-containing protein [Bacteroidota bacterium]
MNAIKRSLIVVVILLSSCLFHQTVQATHLRAAFIKVQQISFRTVRITVEGYSGTGSAVRFGEGLLDFGDGSEPFMLPALEYNVHTTFIGGATTTEPIEYNFSPEAAVVRFTLEHTYASSGQYLVSYDETGRNEGIINIDDSGNTAFYMETQFILRNDSRFYHTPQPLAPQYFFFPTVEQQSSIAYNLGAYDPSDYKLRYELVPNKQDRETEVLNFQLPESVALNRLNGLFTWDGVFLGLISPGEYIYAVRINQFDGDIQMGYMTMDIQIIVEDGDRILALRDDQELNEDNRIVVLPGEQHQIQVTLEGDDFIEDTLMISGELVGSENLEWSTTETFKGRVGTIVLKPTADILRDNPYLISVRAFVNAPSQSTGTQRLLRDINYLVYTRDIEDVDPDPGIITSLPGSDESDLLVYPNPTTRFLNVEGISSDLQSLVLYDLRGEVIEQIRLSGQNRIDLTLFESGVYFYSLLDADREVKKGKIILSK